jgi:hypothetical protein
MYQICIIIILVVVLFLHILYTGNRFLCVVLKFELRAYTLDHSTSLFL